MIKIIQKIKNRKGFTLIELIVVLAVLLIIAGIAVPRFTGVQQEAKIKADKISAGIIKNAAELYATMEPFISGGTKDTPKTDEITIEMLVDKGLLDKEPIKQSNGSSFIIKTYNDASKGLIITVE